MSDTNKKPNRLIHEKSPYLLQHAYNPVHWFAWGPEAFDTAQRQNKPIFLSIGYSTCHWCHVMEKESFEDEEVADYLNEHYVAIKVDREERPDIDHIYMTVCQAMTGQGGWPLTIIMTPDQQPFFAGTYFPKERRYGRMGLLEILKGLSDKWSTDQDRVVGASQQIMDQIAPHMKKAGGGEVQTEWLDDAYDTFHSEFDSEYGGFGREPKFPTPHNLMFLLRYARRTGKTDALEMVEKTLESMYRGGIYDHVGFGFTRYSTDRVWLVPHFEKMLYDNALISLAMLETYQVTGNEMFANVARDVLTYVLRDMRHPDGGFYSAEDADSEGEEGKFYVWSVAEVKDVLGDELADLYCRCFDITESGNFEGQNIPNLIEASIDEFAQREGLDINQWREQVREANRQLFVVREQRVHPYKDDKILTSWNALMMAALARAARVLDDNDYLQAATGAEQFIQTKLRDADGRLLARFRDGQAAHLAYADDYAYLTWALLELYEATYDEQYLDRALQMQEEMNRLFWDSEHGGYFFYGEDGETLIIRPKEVYDGATPSANSVAALNLVRLARITGNIEFERLADRLFHVFSSDVGGYPAGYTFLLMAMDFAYHSTREVVIAGDESLPDTKRMLAEVKHLFLPDTVVLFHPEGERASKIERLSSYIEPQRAVAGKPALYICENFTCRQPLTDVAEAMRLLNEAAH